MILGVDTKNGGLEKVSPFQNLVISGMLSFRSVVQRWVKAAKSSWDMLDKIRPQPKHAGENHYQLLPCDIGIVVFARFAGMLHCSLVPRLH